MDCARSRSVSNGMNVRLKSEKDLEGLRKSGEILSLILKKLKAEVKAGVRLIFFDELARKLLKEAGAKSAFLGYRPAGAKSAFPAAICASVNAQIVHGIPSEYVLKDGDILKIDFGVNYEGYFTDAAFTIGIGKISKDAQELIKNTEEALKKAIKMCLPGNHLGDIGWQIENTVKKKGFKVVNGLTGHGTGFALHEDPYVFNYGRRGEGMVLEPGLVLAIEPMVALGSGDIKQAKDDSFFTADGSLSAHFEKTIAITKNSPEIITLF